MRRQPFCRVSHQALTNANCSICPFLTDKVTKSLLPVMPELANPERHYFIDRDLEIELYGLYRTRQLPQPLQQEYEEDNYEYEQEEKRLMSDECF